MFTKLVYDEIHLGLWMFMGIITIVRWDYELTQRSGTTLYGNKTQDGEVEIGVFLRVKSHVPSGKLT